VRIGTGGLAEHIRVQQVSDHSLAST
jgi:hypothetical protein